MQLFDWKFESVVFISVKNLDDWDIGAGEAFEKEEIDGGVLGLKDWHHIRGFCFRFHDQPFVFGNQTDFSGAGFEEFESIRGFGFQVVFMFRVFDSNDCFAVGFKFVNQAGDQGGFTAAGPANKGECIHGSMIIYNGVLVNGCFGPGILL